MFPRHPHPKRPQSASPASCRGKLRVPGHNGARHLDDVGVRVSDGEYTFRSWQVKQKWLMQMWIIWGVKMEHGDALAIFSLLPIAFIYLFFFFFVVVWITFIVHFLLVSFGQSFFFSFFFSYIDMNQPWIYMYSPSRSHLPPPSPPIAFNNGTAWFNLFSSPVTGCRPVVRMSVLRSGSGLMGQYGRGSRHSTAQSDDEEGSWGPRRRPTCSRSHIYWPKLTWGPCLRSLSPKVLSSDNTRSQLTCPSAS